MPRIEINKNNGLSARIGDDNKPYTIAYTSLKHYHNEITISQHFRPNKEGEFEYTGGILAVFKWNRKYDCNKHLIKHF